MDGPARCIATGGGGPCERAKDEKDLARRREAWEKDRQEQELRLAKRTGQTEAEAVRFAAQRRRTLKTQQEACQQERARLEAEDATPRSGVRPPTATMGSRARPMDGPAGCLAAGGGRAGQGDRSTTGGPCTPAEGVEQECREQEARLAERAARIDAEMDCVAAQQETLETERGTFRRELARLEAEEAARRERLPQEQKELETQLAELASRKDAFERGAAERDSEAQATTGGSGSSAETWERTRQEKELRLVERADQIEAEAARIAAEQDHLQADRAAWRQEESGLEAERAAARGLLAREEAAWKQDCQQQEPPAGRTSGTNRGGRRADGDSGGEPENPAGGVPPRAGQAGGGRYCPARGVRPPAATMGSRARPMGRPAGCLAAGDRGAGQGGRRTTGRPCTPARCLGKRPAWSEELLLQEQTGQIKADAARIAVQEKEPEIPTGSVPRRAGQAGGGRCRAA